jgi:hypothetical protein
METSNSVTVLLSFVMPWITEYPVGGLTRCSRRSRSTSFSVIPVSEPNVSVPVIRANGALGSHHKPSCVQSWGSIMRILKMARRSLDFIHGTQSIDAMPFKSNGVILNRRKGVRHHIFPVNIGTIRATCAETANYAIEAVPVTPPALPNRKSIQQEP